MTNTDLSDNHYFHVCSDGNYASVLFRNETDFKAAMNRVAVCALLCRVVIVAFVLMDNHFHFVLRCRSGDDGLKFAGTFKRLTGKYNHDEYGENKSMHRVPVKVIPVEGGDYLKTLIGYVIKNPTKARKEMFYDYPWGTGGLYFRAAPKHEDAFCVREMSDDAVRKICRTRVKLPSEWRIANGFILPENYVDVEFVERLYKTTRAFMAFLSLNKDDVIERDYGDWNESVMNDAELRSERILLCREMFGTASLRQVSAPDRIRLARELRRRFLCSKRQVARIVQLPRATVEAKL